MSDLISRQAVLNLISYEDKQLFTREHEVLSKLRVRVSELPSVEPKKCGDCIFKQAIIDTIETDCSWTMFDEWGNRTPIGECINEAIKRMPSVESERKSGKWKSTIHHCRRWIVCSQCGAERVYDHSKVWNYCPNCGAKMKVSE